jgi:hypothetical protein
MADGVGQPESPSNVVALGGTIEIRTSVPAATLRPTAAPMPAPALVPLVAAPGPRTVRTVRPGRAPRVARNTPQRGSRRSSTGKSPPDDDGPSDEPPDVARPGRALHPARDDWAQIFEEIGAGGIQTTLFPRSTA